MVNDNLPNHSRRATAKCALVSVIIPAYQAGSNISGTLDSVLAQTFSDYEIILVNDGSPDTELLEQVLRSYPCVRYFKQENRGPSAARNRGILEARSQYVAFLDSDDSWFPQYLSTQIAILRGNPALGLVYGDSLLVRNGIRIGRAFERERQAQPVTFEALLQERSTISTSSTVACRQALIDAGLFDERLNRCEDFDLWLRMAFRGVSIAYHPQANVLHNVSSSGLSANGYLMKQARIEVYKKIDASLPLSRGQRELLMERYRLNAAGAHLDLVKGFMRQGKFEKALASAQLASTVFQGWKLRLAVLGLNWAPRVLGACYGAHRRMLAVRNRVRAARSARRVGAMHRPQLSTPRVESLVGMQPQSVAPRFAGAHGGD